MAYDQRKIGPAWTCEQSDESLRCPHEEGLGTLQSIKRAESSLCAQCVFKDPWFLHADSEDCSDWADAQADRNLRWAHSHMVLSWGGSFYRGVGKHRLYMSDAAARKHGKYKTTMYQCMRECNRYFGIFLPKLYAYNAPFSILTSSVNIPRIHGSIAKFYAYNVPSHGSMEVL